MATNPTEVIKHTGNNVPDVDRGASQSDTMGSELARTAEAGTAQLEASARAEIQAQYYLARQFPRNWDQVEQRLRKECKRPGFANSAWWILPLGPDPKKYPAGLSIRFAESALRMATNIDVQQMVVRDDQWQRIVRIRVRDLETNFGYTSEVIVDKTVERTDPKDRPVLSYRENSRGRLVYVVAATEQQIALKQGSAVSKAIRTNGLRLIPGDLLDECKTIIVATRAAGAAAEDPEEARKKILDSFADINVYPDDIAKLVEHETSHFLPADRELLRGVYAAIKNGIVTWREVLEAKFGPQEGAEESPGAKKVKDILNARTKPVPSPEPAKQPIPEDPKPATQSSSTPPPQTTPTDTGETLRDYADFPDCPPQNGVIITFKGQGYVSTDGNWRPINGEKASGKKRDRGTLNFGE